MTPILYIGPAIACIGDRLNVDMDDIEYITETTLTIRNTRRRTTVPKTIVDKLDLDSGDKIRWILFKDDKILITRVQTGG